MFRRLEKKIKNCDKNIAVGAHAAIGGLIIVGAIVGGVFTFGALPLAFVIVGSIVGGAMAIGGTGWSIYNYQKREQIVKQIEQKSSDNTNKIEPAKTSQVNSLQLQNNQNSNSNFSLLDYLCCKSKKNSNSGNESEGKQNNWKPKWF